MWEFFLPGPIISGRTVFCIDIGNNALIHMVKLYLPHIVSAGRKPWGPSGGFIEGTLGIPSRGSLGVPLNPGFSTGIDYNRNIDFEI